MKGVLLMESSNRSVFCYLYESTIIEQQITHHVLNEEYLKLKGETAVNEAFNFKDKIAKFGKFVRKIWDAIITFITKTFPGWVKTAVNKILEVLKIKKDPVTVDLNKVEEGTDAETKDKIVSEINKANKANGKILRGNYHVGKAPTINNEKNEDKSKENDNKKEVATAEKEVEQACENLENIAKQDGVSPEVKSEIQNAVSAVKQRKYVVASKSPRFVSDSFEGEFYENFDNVEKYFNCLRLSLNDLWSMRISKLGTFMGSLLRSQHKYDKERDLGYYEDEDDNSSMAASKKYVARKFSKLEKDGAEDITFQKRMERWMDYYKLPSVSEIMKLSTIKITYKQAEKYCNIICDKIRFGNYKKDIDSTENFIKDLLKYINEADNLNDIPQQQISNVTSTLNKLLQDIINASNVISSASSSVFSKFLEFSRMPKKHNPEVKGSKYRGLK